MKIFPDGLFVILFPICFIPAIPEFISNRREFPIDFPAWFNKDDVAIGKDAVVDKALEWIDNLVYPHNVVSDKTYYSPADDTVHLFTTIENPNAHQVSARAYLKTTTGILIDSIDLSHLTLNSGGEQWTADINLPEAEEFYKIDLTAFDETDSNPFSITNATRFTTAGPVKVDSIEYSAYTNFRYLIQPFIKNESASLTFNNLQIKLLSDDPWVTQISPASRILTTISPGEIKPLSNPFAVSYDSATYPGYFNFKFEILKDGWTYWKDSTQVAVGVNEKEFTPLTFNLEQNYPNPFNPATTIKYSIPEISRVKLTLFNLLGGKVITLVNEEKPAGEYVIEFNAANMPSGVYFYQIKAGNYVETKKMILLK